MDFSLNILTNIAASTHLLASLIKDIKHRHLP